MVSVRVKEYLRMEGYQSTETQNVVDVVFLRWCSYGVLSCKHYCNSVHGNNLLWMITASAIRALIFSDTFPSPHCVVEKHTLLVTRRIPVLAALKGKCWFNKVTKRHCVLCCWFALFIALAVKWPCVYRTFTWILRQLHEFVKSVVVKQPKKRMFRKSDVWVAGYGLQVYF